MKVPHLLKGRFRDDIRFRFDINFFLRCAGFIPAYRQAGNAAQGGYEDKAQFFYPTRLHRTLISVVPP